MQLQQQTDQWLAYRRERIGASDAPVIMGDSPWSTPYKRWQEKMGLAQCQAQSYAMKRGLDKEEMARQMFLECTDIEVTPRVLVHPELEWMIASMDGVSHNGRIGVEIKAPGAEDHACAKRGEVPKKYKAQLQHQHEVGRFETLYYVSIGKDDDFVYFEVPRDDIYIAEMLEKEKAFYDCLSSFESPDLCDRDYIDCSDTDLESAATAWVDISRQIRVLEAREKELRQTLIAAARQHPVRCAGVKVCSHTRKGAVDYKTIPELRGVDLDEYRKPSVEVWKITEM